MMYEHCQHNLVDDDTDKMLLKKAIKLREKLHKQKCDERKAFLGQKCRGGL